MSGTSGRGLRGGSYTVTTTATATTIDYQGVHFSNDVSVSGHATRDLATNTIDAQVTVVQVEDQSGDQQGHADQLQGTLSFHGVLFTPSQPNGQVRGVIDGRQVALLVPMN
jgi:hypothetical protein